MAHIILSFCLVSNNDYEFLMPGRVCGSKKNSSKKGGLYYAGVWQELVVNESPDLLKWVEEILSSQ